MTNLADRIQLGTLFLDDVRPGWAGHIDTNRLDLANPESCVLGQLFADEDDTPFGYGRTGFLVGSFAFHDWLVDQGFELDEETNAAALGGFERDDVHANSVGWAKYRELQDEWMKVITR